MRYLSTIFVAVLAGAGVTNAARLDEALPLIVQAVLVFLALVYAYAKLSADLNKNGMPDWADKRPWLLPAVKIVFLAVPLLAGAGGIAAVSGCGFQVQVRQPSYHVADDGPDDDLIPDQSEFSMRLETNKGFDIQLHFVQGFGGFYPATACFDLIATKNADDPNDDFVFETYCGSCEWAEGLSACRLLPSTSIPGVEEVQRE